MPGYSKGKERKGRRLPHLAIEVLEDGRLVPVAVDAAAHVAVAHESKRLFKRSRAVVRP